MNTISKLSRRKCSELQGLKMSRFTDSFVTSRGALLLDTYPEENCTNYNTHLRISRRSYKELNGLYYKNICLSKRKARGMITKLRFVDSSIRYRRILNFYRKYNNEMRW